MSAESLLIILLVGGIAGWLAGLIVRGTGFGLVAESRSASSAPSSAMAVAEVGVRSAPASSPRLSSPCRRDRPAPPSRFVPARRRQSDGWRTDSTPPGFPIFAISLVLAICVARLSTAASGIPLSTVRPFDILAIAYALLVVGVVFRGI